MKGGKRPLGYTIVEVMIVLAVSGVMFLIAAQFINGKQAQTAFSEGTNDLASQIQAIIEDVTDGHYSGIPVSCTGSGPLVIGVGTPGTQGQNLNCVFLGKLLHFSENDIPTQYEVFSLAGALNVTAGGCATVSGPAADPLCDSATPICTSDSCNSSTDPADLTTQAVVPQSLDVPLLSITPAATVGDPTPTPLTTSFGIGFVQSFGAVTGGAYQTGSPTVEMIYAPGLTNSSTNNYENGAATAIEQPGGIAAAQQVDICVTDGSRWADITIGSSATTQLSVDVKMGVTPVCHP
jgi:prepilin-type N-terminal cleavage/methylation domain-containing protein